MQPLSASKNKRNPIIALFAVCLIQSYLSANAQYFPLVPEIYYNDWVNSLTNPALTGKEPCTFMSLMGGVYRLSKQPLAHSEVFYAETQREGHKWNKHGLGGMIINQSDYFMAKGFKLRYAIHGYLSWDNNIRFGMGLELLGLNYRLSDSYENFGSAPLAVNDNHDFYANFDAGAYIAFNKLLIGTSVYNVIPEYITDDNLSPTNLLVHTHYEIGNELWYLHVIPEFIFAYSPVTKNYFRGNLKFIYREDTKAMLKLTAKPAENMVATGAVFQKHFGSVDIGYSLEFSFRQGYQKIHAFQSISLGYVICPKDCGCAPKYKR